MTDLKIKIINQLNKDLSLAGYSIAFSNNFSMKETINKLIVWVSIESEFNLSCFSQFLYSIDLDESCLKSFEKIDNESLVLDILQRLKSKVINREKFSNI